MYSNWATEHLLVIRTLMERSAIYRRALAPIVLTLGVLGIVAALLGGTLVASAARTFIVYWSGVGLTGITAAYLMARQQALRDAESFWSAPTRRVTQALLPPLFVGFVASAVAAFEGTSNLHPASWIVPVWMVLYGCALHAAGFFMPRGMKLFGWGFIALGCLLAAWLASGREHPSLVSSHWIMGGSFGGLHLAYGAYLSVTEKNQAVS
jgi:hypothetical protein